VPVYVADTERRAHEGEASRRLLPHHRGRSARGRGAGAAKLGHMTFAEILKGWWSTAPESVTERLLELESLGYSTLSVWMNVGRRIRTSVLESMRLFAERVIRGSADAQPRPCDSGSSLCRHEV
jgi:hypothetical protein